MPDQQIYGDRYFDPDDPKNQLPPKKKTKGEQLEEEGDYIDTGELDDQGQPEMFTQTKQLFGTELANDIEEAVSGFGASAFQKLIEQSQRQDLVGGALRFGGDVISGSIENVEASKDPFNLQDEYGSSNPLINLMQIVAGYSLRGTGKALELAGTPARFAGEKAGDVAEFLGVDPRLVELPVEFVSDIYIGAAAPKLLKKGAKLSAPLLEKLVKSGNERLRGLGSIVEGAQEGVQRVSGMGDTLQTAITGGLDVGTARDVSGTAAQRMSAAVDSLKKRGFLRRDGSLRQLPTVTSRARGRTGNADLVNALSDRKTWNIEGDKAIKETVEGLTERERRLAGKWHKHHKRPLSQNSWLVQGLEGDELAKAHKYSYKRMAAGGDVLENQRIIFDKAHDATHRYMNALIGEMRSGKGRSIQGLLDPGMNPQDFINLKTFEERKFAFSRFFDTTDAADLKTQHILNAMDSAKTKGATISISDANSLLNRLDFDNFNKIDDIRDIAILDDFLKDLNKLMDPKDVNSLRKINEGLNANEATWLPIATQLEPLQKILDEGGTLSRSQKTIYKALKKKSDALEIEADDLLDRKTNLLPPQAVRKYESSIERMMRGSDNLTHGPGMFTE